MKLLFEELTAQANPVEVLHETVNGKSRMFIEGIYAQADVPNRNRRNYPSKVLMPEVNKYIKEYVETKRAIGELNHPTHPKPNPKEASHLINKLTIEGSNVLGKAQILDGTPNGNLVRALLDNGVQLGVSTRGLGSTTENAGIDTVTKYSMYAIDVVADPSAPDAFVNGIMEGVEWMAESGEISKVILEDFHRKSKISNKHEAVAAMTALFESLVKGR